VFSLLVLLLWRQMSPWGLIKYISIYLSLSVASYQAAHTCTRYSLERSGRRTCSIRWAKCSCRTSLSWLTQAITASNTCTGKHTETREAHRVRPFWLCCPTCVYWAEWMFVYLLLSGDGELVAGDQAGHLLHAQIKELFTPNHLGEMLLCQQKHGMKITTLQMNTSLSFLF